MEQEKELKEAIDTNLVILWGGVFKNYDKDEYIFREGQQPHFYHQVVEGKIRMVNEEEDGKEFIQGFLLPAKASVNRQYLKTENILHQLLPYSRQLLFA